MGVLRTASTKKMIKGQRGTNNLKDADPEEGEIVDDYEYILSSDEELTSTRQRIKELEATNEELEKISLISRNFGKYEYLPCNKLAVPVSTHNPPIYIDDDNDKVQDTRCKRQLPSDMSSISSGEFTTPKKRKRSKGGKLVRNKMPEHSPREHYWRHQYHRHHCHHRKKRRHNCRHVGRRVRCDQKWEAVSFESLEEEKHVLRNSYQIHSSEESDLTLSLSDEGDRDINREELRFALARPMSKKNATSSLMERLRREKMHTEAKEKEEITEKTNVELIKIDDDSDDILEEQELRLIALKSAIIKKHLARKKRNAELAYSPTDFDDLLINSTDFDDNIGVVEGELNGVQTAGMELSPVASPKLLNLEQEGEDLSNGVNSGAVDTKPVDMDIVGSESDVEIVAYDGEQSKLKPIAAVPLNSTSADVNIPLPTSIAPEMPYHMYMQGLQYEPAPPPPLDLYYDEEPPPAPSFSIPNSVVDNKDDADLRYKLAEDSEEPQLPQPITQNEKVNCEDMERQCSSTNRLHSSNAVKPLTFTCYEELTLNVHPQPTAQDSEYCSNENNQESDEEEEKALRALLLAKIQSPINPRRKIAPKQKRDPLVASQRENERNEGLLADAVEQEGTKIPAEAILKEAVRRLNNKSYPLNVRSYDLDKQNATTNPAIRTESILEQKNIRYAFKTSGKSVFGNSFKKNALIQCNKRTSAKSTIKDLVECNELDNRGLKDQINSKMLETSANVVEESYKKTFANTEKVAESVLDIREKAIRSQKDIKEPQATKNIEKVKIGIMENAVTGENAITEAVQESEYVTKDAPAITHGGKIQSEETEIDNKQNVHNENTLHTVISPSTANVKKPPEDVLKDLKPNSVSTISPSIAQATPLKSKPAVRVLENSKLKTLLDRSVALSQVTSMLPSQKIVKPNKVINTNPQLKRKSIVFSNDLSKTKMTKINATLPIPSSKRNNPSSSRLITSLDLPTLQVKKLVITLRPSDSEDDVSNCDDEISGDTRVPRNALLGPVCSSALPDDNYYDNTSPMSLRMDSPVEHSLGASFPRTETEVVPSSAIASNAFEQKLDNFLRNIRSQEKQRTEVGSSFHPTEESEGVQQKNAHKLMTPLAVRHLPKASQLEYRRLVHRMNMLQKQKQAKITQPPNGIENSTSDNTTNTLSSNLSHTNLPKASPDTVVPNVGNITGNEMPELLLSKTCTAPASPSSKEVPPKVNVLRTYESSYNKIGAGIISNLEKSFKLVEEAKKAKIVKLRHEKRLKVLQAEMDDVRRKYKQELQKMAKIYPAICDSNEIISTLKQKRFKLFKCANSLGRSIQGEDYRLNNELKQEISFKTAELAAAIKFVNSLKYSDLDKLDACTGKVETLNGGHKEKNTEITKDQTIGKNINISQSKDGNDESTATVKHLTTKVQQQCEKSTCSEEKEAHTEIENSSSLQMINNENQEDQREIRLNDQRPQELALQQQKETTDMDTKVLSEYVSPLSSCTKECNIKSGNLDPHGIICPFELMGKCEDVDCIYTHFDRKSATESVP